VVEYSAGGGCARCSTCGEAAHRYCDFKEGGGTCPDRFESAPDAGIHAERLLWPIRIGREIPVVAQGADSTAINAHFITAFSSGVVQGRTRSRADVSWRCRSRIRPHGAWPTREAAHALWDAYRHGPRKSPLGRAFQSKHAAGLETPASGRAGLLDSNDLLNFRCARRPKKAVSHPFSIARVGEV